MSGRRTHQVRAYYAPGVTKKVRGGRVDVSGQLAIETVHCGEDGAALEADVARSRPDIGRVEIVDLRPAADRAEPGQ